VFTRERLVVSPPRHRAVALCDAGHRARLGSSLLQVPLPTTLRASLSRTTPCLFTLTVTPPSSWPTTMASAPACSRTRTPLNSCTRAPVVRPRMRTRLPRGKEPCLPFVSLD
jgi:hypothetical protein